MSTEHLWNLRSATLSLAGLIRCGAVAALATAWCALGISTAYAADSAKIKIEKNIDVKDTGDADVKLEIKLSAEAYTSAKQNYPSMAVLLRRFGIDMGWAMLENVRGKLDDNDNTLTVEYRHVGFARMNDAEDKELWEVALDPEIKVESSQVSENEGTYITNVATDLGTAAVTAHVKAPHAATDMKWHHNPEKISYHYSPTIAPSTDTRYTFAVKTNSKIMPSSAKCYAVNKLTGLWVARTAFKNSGGQTLPDYQVRCRLAGFGEWTGWKGAKRVLPGQTVVDAFFLSVDPEKLGAVTGSRWVSLQVEFEYRPPTSDKPVRLEKSEDVMVLGRNQVKFTNLADENAVGFFDKYYNAPVVASAFVTGDDPLLQALATRLTSLAGVNEIAQADDADKFLDKLCDSLRANKISCQSKISETVKYGRDVILGSKSGSSLDLAILVASLCDAVKLSPTLYFTPDDCLAAVQFPGGRTVTLDMSKIGSDTRKAAEDEGAKKLQDARSKGQLITIDIASWRANGVLPLDLGKFEGKLDECWKLDASGSGYSSTVTTTANPSTAEQKVDLKKLAGKWTAGETRDGRTTDYTLTMTEDAKYTYRAVVTPKNEPRREVLENGTFQADVNTIRFVPSDNQQADTYYYRLRTNPEELDLQLQGSTTLVTFKRAK